MAGICTFIAVDLPQQIKMEIDKMIADFRQLNANIRWVKAVNLHLTLRFLGNIPEETIPALAENIRGNTDGFESFQEDLRHTGLQVLRVGGWAQGAVKPKYKRSSQIDRQRLPETATGILLTMKISGKPLSFFS